MKKIPTIVPVVAVALLDQEGQVLMQKRRGDAQHRGLLEFPGCKWEAGETLTEALCREVMEELGITVDPDRLAPLSFAALPDQPHVILLYTCREWSGTPVCMDGEAIAWFPLDAICQLGMPPLDVPLADALLKAEKRSK